MTHPFRTLALGFFIFLTLLACSSRKPLYDERVKGLIDNENLVYEIDRDGDFKVSLPLLGLEGTPYAHENVWIVSYLKPLGDLNVRELFSLSIALPAGIPASLLESLMADSYNNRFLGSWVILERDGGVRYLAYLVKLSTSDLTSKNLMTILTEMAESSYAMREVLSTSVPSFRDTQANVPIAPQSQWQGEGDPDLYPPALDYPPAH